MPPILLHKDYDAESAFKPENLLREARRQKSLPEASVPEICILDPDGDMVLYLCNAGFAVRHPGWACYHTEPRLRSSSPRSCSRPAAGFLSA